jgi:hypothetical protein
MATARSTRLKRQSTSDFIMSQKKRSTSSVGAEPQLQAGQQVISAETSIVPAAPVENAPAGTSVAAACFQGQSLFEDLSEKHADTLRSVDTNYDLGGQVSRRGLEEAAALKRETSRLQAAKEVVLTSIEELSSDLGIKTGLRLSTPHHSFKWLRQLPVSLRAQQRISEGTKEHIMAMCRECLPNLASDPDKAVKFLEKAANCLAWYEKEGPRMPLERNPENEDVWQQVLEWDEAFRSLMALLNQGVISTFALVAEQFTVTVLGDGTGPFTQAGKENARKPSSKQPCAVLSPSFNEIREMLQENQVAFEIAELPNEASADAMETLVPYQAKDASLSRSDDVRDLRELFRDGEKIIAPEDAAGAASLMSSTLWFEGQPSVFGLLDILRQHALGAPLEKAPKSPTKLPRLVANATFCNAVRRTAKVQSTQTISSGAANTAELVGYFFPSQVKNLLQLLRVLLQTFSCTLLANETPSNKDVNAFTSLGKHRVESISCERICAGVGQTAPEWKWALRLET